MWILVNTFIVVMGITMVYDIIYMIGSNLSCGHIFGIPVIDNTLWIINRFVYLNLWIWILMFVIMKDYVVKSKKPPPTEVKERPSRKVSTSSSSMDFVGHSASMPSNPTRHLTVASDTSYIYQDHSASNPYLKN